MLKIGAVIAVPMAIGFVAFPQFRATIASLAPFALFALCPIGMLFGMKGMMGGNGKSCSYADMITRVAQNIYQQRLRLNNCHLSSGT